MGLETMAVETGDSGRPDLFGGAQKRLEPDGLGAKRSKRASERGPTDYGYGGGVLERLKSDRC